MEVDMAGAALSALGTILEPARMAFLVLGVAVGLIVGVIPGLGGLIGMSLMLPFTYGLDPYAAIAMLIGLSAVTTTSDTIPAVLFGVPGTVGSAATTLDGFPMAQKGEASRALGAAFMASMLGGLFGALLLGLSIPMLRPFILGIATPELLAFCIFGLSLVAAVSGGSAMKGVAAACFGILLSCIGEDTQMGVLRWTFGQLYLWDGLPLVPLALGLFALPELAELYIRKSAIAGTSAAQARAARVSQFDGVRDVITRPFLFLRCSAIGALLGAVPGIGAAVIDWVAYGHAARTEKGAADTFGSGDVRGVIASESANNAKEGGSLVPTIAFGVPGSASMALLLGAFTVHGVVPGPQMLGARLDVTYSMVWSVALANVIGAGVCFLGAKQLGKLALVRPEVLVPTVLSLAFIGALQATRVWEDLYVFIAAGLVGFAMKRLGWPRPPLILGFVLGALVERYAFITVSRYGAFDWMTRPLTAVVLVMALWGIGSPTLRALMGMARGTGRRMTLSWSGSERPFGVLMAAATLAVFFWAWTAADAWPRATALAPRAAAAIGVVAAAMALLSTLFIRMTGPAELGSEPVGPAPDAEGTSRALQFFGWLLFLLASGMVIGVLPAVLVMLLLWLGVSGRLGVSRTVIITLGVTAFSYTVFHWIVGATWPDAVIGDIFPELRAARATRLF